MPNTDNDAAAAKAEEYAPMPKDSAPMAGIVSGITAGLALAFFGRFYAIDILRYPVLIAAVVVSSFLVAFLWSRVLKRRHVRAKSVELQKITDDRIDRAGRA